MEVKTPFTKDEIREMVQEVLSDKKYDGKMVLVCWNHKMIPEIAEEFGVDPAPQKWPGDIFDQVWEIDYSGGEVAAFKMFTEDVDMRPIKPHPAQ